MLKLDFNAIKSTYSGINGRCCCGCAGKHTNRESGPRAEHSMKNIIKKIQAAIDRNDKTLGVESNHVYFIQPNSGDGRLYIAYFD